MVQDALTVCFAAGFAAVDPVRPAAAAAAGDGMGGDKRDGCGQQHPMNGTSAGQKGSSNSMMIFSYVPILSRDSAEVVS